MGKIKLMVLAAALALPAMAFAYNYSWLTFRMTDGTELSVASENLAINYKDGNLILSSSTVDKTIPASQLKSMKFTLTTGVNDIFADQSTEGDYYDPSGIKVGTYPSIEEARKALPSGIYIIKGINRTIKVTL